MPNVGAPNVGIGWQKCGEHGRLGPAVNGQRSLVAGHVCVYITWNNKCINIAVSPDNYLDTAIGDLVRLLANCVLLFCSDFAVLIFPTLLADIQFKVGKGSPSCKHTVI